MYYRQHQWIDIPHTAYERRRELRVRESKHTVMLWDKKYYNIDTGKYDTDKIHTINSCLLVDIMSEYGNSTDGYQDELVHDEYELLAIERKAIDKANKLRRRKERELLREQRELRELERIKEEEDYARQLAATEKRLADEWELIAKEQEALRKADIEFRSKYGCNVLVTRW